MYAKLIAFIFQWTVHLASPLIHSSVQMCFCVEINYNSFHLLKGPGTDEFRYLFYKVLRPVLDALLSVFFPPDQCPSKIFLQIYAKESWGLSQGWGIGNTAGSKVRGISEFLNWSSSCKPSFLPTSFTGMWSSFFSGHHGAVIIIIMNIYKKYALCQEMCQMFMDYFI